MLSIEHSRHNHLLSYHKKAKKKEREIAKKQKQPDINICVRSRETMLLIIVWEQIKSYENTTQKRFGHSFVCRQFQLRFFNIWFVVTKEKIYLQHIDNFVKCKKAFGINLCLLEKHLETFSIWNCFVSGERASFGRKSCNCCDLTSTSSRRRPLHLIKTVVWINRLIRLTKILAITLERKIHQRSSVEQWKWTLNSATWAFGSKYLTHSGHRQFGCRRTQHGMKLRLVRGPTSTMLTTETCGGPYRWLCHYLS